MSGVHAKSDTCAVSYEELLEEDGSKVVENAVALHRMRPVLADWLAERKLSNKVRSTLPGVPGVQSMRVTACSPSRCTALHSSALR